MSDEEKQKLAQFGCADIDDAINLIEELQYSTSEMEYYETQLKEYEDELNLYKTILNEVLTPQQKLDYRLTYGDIFDIL